MSHRIASELVERFHEKSDIGLGLLVTWLRGVSTAERSPVPARLVPRNDWEQRQTYWAKEIASLKDLDPRSVVGLGWLLEWRQKSRPSPADIRSEYERRMAA